MGRGGEDRDGRLIDLRVSVGRACEEWGEVDWGAIHVHGSPPRAHPVPGRGSGGSGAQPREIFLRF